MKPARIGLHSRQAVHGYKRKLCGCDPRKVKRFERQNYGPVYEAYCRGASDGAERRAYAGDGFPPGERRRAYDRGFFPEHRAAACGVYGA